MRDTGMVSVEFAAALPAVVFVLAVGLSAVRVGIDSIRTADAARVAVRAAARGDPFDRIAALVNSSGPAGSHLTVRHNGDSVMVTVTARVGSPVGWIVGSPTLRSSATAPLEAEVDSAPP